MSDENLNIRARRSKKPRSAKKIDEPAMRNPLLDHTLDDDLPFIREYAKLYESIPDEIKKVLNMYSFEGKSLEYYYGSYVATYQAFVMAYQAQNDIAPALMSLVHARSACIIKALEEKRNNIAKAAEVAEIK